MVLIQWDSIGESDGLSLSLICVTQLHAKLVMGPIGTIVIHVQIPREPRTLQDMSASVYATVALVTRSDIPIIQLICA
jgi:hypothetical protein